MAQLWGGRFTKETDQLVYNFNASVSFDQKFFRQDIEGSIVHTIMLAKQGILTKEEKDEILKGLTGIRQDVEDGKLTITEEYEDIHSFVEANLIGRIGDVGKKLHTGRSRNDQDYENGMGISVGRIREDSVYDWKFVGLSHNTVRGAAGGAVLCAETLKAKGYISKK